MSSNKETSCLTIGNTTFKTSGNIIFSDGDEDRYYIAENSVLEKIDKAIQNGIVENGMQSLLKKARA